eukprot:6402494-Lingulodinium_polyedra.AAC.1
MEEFREVLGPARVDAILGKRQAPVRRPRARPRGFALFSEAPRDFEGASEVAGARCAVSLRGQALH